MKKRIFSLLTIALTLLLLLTSCGGSSAPSTPSHWTKGGTVASSDPTVTPSDSGAGAADTGSTNTGSANTGSANTGSTPSGSGTYKILSMLASENLTNPNGFGVNISVLDAANQQIDLSKISATIVVKDDNGTELYNGAATLTASQNGGYPLLSLDYSLLKSATTNKGTAKYTVKAGSTTEVFENALKKLPVKVSSVVTFPTFPTTVNHCGKDWQTGEYFPYAKLTVKNCTFDDAAISDGDKVTLTFDVTCEKVHESCPKSVGFYLVVTQKGNSKKVLVSASFGTDGKPATAMTYQLRVYISDGPITLSIEDYK